MVAGRGGAYSAPHPIPETAMTTQTLPNDALPTPSMPASQRIAQAGLYIVGAIALLGGTLQMVLGQPETTPRLDNVHRFMAGIYFSTGVISVWAARTIRQQGPLVYLIAFGVLLAGLGRLLSIAQVGLPEPAAVWLGYLIPELLLPFAIAGAHRLSGKGR